MSGKEYGTYGPGVDAEQFFTSPVYYQDGIDTVPSKEYSRYVSELMDRLGYSYDLIKDRQQTFAECDRLQNCHRILAYKTFTTGGKGEGTTLFYESDIDHMFAIKDVICADNPQHFNQQMNITLFQTETQKTSSGYTRLKLLSFDGRLYKEKISSSLLKDENGSYYLSSECFVNAVKRVRRQNFFGDGYTLEPTSGPSVPGSDTLRSYDQVLCFRCFCPSILKRWLSRYRSHGWPPPATVHEISRLDGHVVPIGCKGSHDKDREWRICYSLAELHLMRNLNEAQLKVYILLKKISKAVLNTVCKEMTSYVMKNIILWVCESNGLGGFTQDLIMERLFDCIQYLKKCVCENSLPSYMIRERNLLAGRVDTRQKQQLISVLNDLLQERGRMLLRCEKLRGAMIMMYKTPNMLRECSEKRDKVESLMLMKRRIRAEVWKPKMIPEELWQRLIQHELYCTHETRIDHLMQFDYQEYRQMGKTHEEITDLRNAKLIHLLA